MFRNSVSSVLVMIFQRYEININMLQRNNVENYSNMEVKIERIKLILTYMNRRNIHSFEEYILFRNSMFHITGSLDL